MELHRGSLNRKRFLSANSPERFVLGQPCTDSGIRGSRLATFPYKRFAKQFHLPTFFLSKQAKPVSRVLTLFGFELQVLGLWLMGRG